MAGHVKQDQTQYTERYLLNGREESASSVGTRTSDGLLQLNGVTS